MKYLFFTIFAFSIVGCSTIHYRSKGEIPVYFSSNRSYTQPFRIAGSTDFYFWGQYPESQIIYLDQEAKKEGWSGISKLVIHEYVTFQDWFYSVISLGLYTPRHYKISGYGHAL